MNYDRKDAMATQVVLAAEARRKSDTVNLAAELERIFREHTVGERDLDSTRVVPKHRGGYIELRAFVDTDDPAAILRGIGEAIDTNRNLVDRVDVYRAQAFEGSKTRAFRRADYRGWLRDAALDELAEVAP